MNVPSKAALATLIAVLGARTFVATGLQTGLANTPEAHVARAKAAAGDTYQNLFNFLCTPPPPASAGATAGRPRAGGPGPGARSGGVRPAPPERSTWYVDPVKVFDNLYFLGQSEYSAWAVTTSDGIILIDTLFDYAVMDEVVVGARKVGLEAGSIKYAVVTHAHPDHSGGALVLQNLLHTRILMSGADWDAMDRLSAGHPQRDLVATDGQRLTLGDTTVTLYITPGHTPGTLSALIPVTDNGVPHLVALWGGTGLNPDRASLEQYIQSVQRFDDIAQKAGADIILSNHTDWDGSKANLPMLAKRTPGVANPYVVGTAAVRRYLEVARECAMSRALRLD